MRKTIFILSTFLLSMLFLCSTALAGAFPLGIYFDKTGGGAFGDENYVAYGVGYGTTSADRQEYISIFDGVTRTAGIITSQSFGADNILGNYDTFTQNAIFSINAALDIQGDDWGDDRLVRADNWKMEINLSGYIFDYIGPGYDVTTTNPEGIQEATFTSRYTGGDARFYHVDADGNEIADIAQFAFRQGTDVNLEPSLWGESLGDEISFKFDWTWANYNYFGDELFDPSGALLSDLITLNLAFSTSQDSINLINDLGEYADGVKVLTRTTGGKADFQAVPEPTTMLLFGTGLLGLGFFARRKFVIKKG